MYHIYPGFWFYEFHAESARLGADTRSLVMPEEA
jgi:hypothetical protein